MPPPKPKRRLLIGPAGVEKWADPAQLEEHGLPEGYALAGSDAEAAWLRRAKFGGGLETAIAGTVGAARGVTLGLFDPAMVAAAEAIGGELGAEEMRGVLTGLREEHPAVTMGGELGSLAIGIPGARAPGLVGKLGSAMPIRGALKAGELAERGALRLAPRSPVLAGAVRAGAEGAVFGAGHAVSESALGNTDLIGEQLAISIGAGGALGFGMGAGLGVVGKTLTGAGRGLKGALVRAGPKDLAEVGAGTLGVDAAPGLGTRMADAWAGVTSVTSTASRADLQALARSGAQRVKAVYGAPEALESTATSLLQGGESMIRAQGILKRLQTIAKPGAMSPLVATGREAAQLAESKAAHAEVYGILRSIADDPFTFGESPQITKLVRRLARNTRNLDDAVAKGGPKLAPELRTITERSKRDVDQVVSSLTKSKTASYENLKAGDALRPAADRLRKLLEKQDVWGEAAAAHGLQNRATAEGLESRDLFDSRLTRALGRDPENPYLKARAMDGDKVRAALRGFGTEDGNLTHRAISEQLDATEAGIGVALKYHKSALSKADVEALESAAAAIKQTRGDIAKTSDALKAAGQLRAIDEAQSRGPGAVLGGLLGAGGVYGVAEGDPTLAGIGLAGAALTRPGAVIRQLAAIRKMTGSVSDKIGSGTSKLFAKSAAPPLTYGLPRYGTMTWRQAEKEFGTADKARLEHERRAEAIRQVSDKQVRSGLGQALAPMAETAPAIFEATKQAGQRVVDYLREQLPTQDVQHALMGARPMPSNAELGKFARALAVADSPVDTVLDLMNEERLSRDHAEAIRGMFPELYSEIATNLLDQITEAQAEGKRLPWEKRKQISLFLGTPTDDFLRTDVLQAVQASFTPMVPQQQPGPSGPSRPSDLARKHRSGSEETAMEET